MSDKNDKDQGTPSKPDGAKKRKMSESHPIDVPSTSGVEQPQLPSWVAGGSPAKFLAPDDLLKMSAAMDNLALVHEIAIDPNFQIEKAPVNPIEAAVKENMHRAYWDLLRQDLEQDPPVYQHAFNLLMEIKETIHNELLGDRHVRLRSELNLILDENSLRSKMEQGCLDVKAVSHFVLELLGRLCAPERDAMIEKIRTEENIPDIIKGIFELMDLMKNDLFNFVISENRQAVEAHSAKLEYEAFQKYLEHVPDGCQKTKQWLATAYDEVFPPVTAPSPSEEPNTKMERVASPEVTETEDKPQQSLEVSDDELIKTTSRGYLHLARVENPPSFPETLRIDRGRLMGIAEKFLQMTMCTSAVFVTCNIAGKQISETDGFKKTLKDHLILITNDIEEKNVDTVLMAVAEQCVKEVREISSTLSLEFPADREQLLRSQLAAINEDGNAVRLLVCSRLSRFVEEMLCSPTEIPRRLLPGLSVIEVELCAFTARLLRICVHNRKTFSQLYQNLIMDIRASREENHA